MEDTTTLLTEISHVFPQTALSCVEAMFDKEAATEETWTVVPRLSGNADRIITLGSANSEFSSLIMAAMSEETLIYLLDDDEIDHEYASDVMGEFANAYCAILDDNDEFVSQFGRLTQAVPVLETNGTLFLPFMTGIEGSIHVGDHSIYMGYTIRATLKKDQQ
ncbi:MAG: hypothetical protein ACQEQV_06930 [Fibrobacterota bacterium]